jgi:hypothetical protein
MIRGHTLFQKGTAMSAKLLIALMGGNPCDVIPADSNTKPIPAGLAVMRFLIKAESLSTSIVEVATRKTAGDLTVTDLDLLAEKLVSYGRKKIIILLDASAANTIASFLANRSELAEAAIVLSSMPDPFHQTKKEGAYSLGIGKGLVSIADRGMFGTYGRKIFDPLQAGFHSDKVDMLSQNMPPFLMLLMGGNPCDVTEVKGKHPLVPGAAITSFLKKMEPRATVLDVAVNKTPDELIENDLKYMLARIRSSKLKSVLIELGAPSLIPIASWLAVKKNEWGNKSIVLVSTAQTFSNRMKQGIYNTAIARMVGSVISPGSMKGVFRGEVFDPLSVEYNATSSVFAERTVTNDKSA